MPLRILILLLLGLALPFRLLGDDQIDPTSFARLYEHYQQRRQTPPPPVRHEADDIHYLFVSGFLGEYNAHYFEMQMAELEKLGVPGWRIHLIKPSSTRSIEENTKRLWKRLQRIPGKIVIVAHSKGAAESVATALKHPEFVESRIEGIYCIQGAFGGSPLASSLTRPGPLGFSIDHLPRFQRWLLQGLRYGAGYFFTPPFRRALESLSHEGAERYWNEMMQAHRDAIPIVSPKVHYITTKTTRHQLSPVITPSYGPNDGVLAVKHQQLPGLGHVVAELDGEHEAFVSDLRSGEIFHQHRQSIMRTIYAAVETRGRPPGSPHCPWGPIARQP